MTDDGGASYLVEMRKEHARNFSWDTTAGKFVAVLREVEEATDSRNLEDGIKNSRIWNRDASCTRSSQGK